MRTFSAIATVVAIILLVVSLSPTPDPRSSGPRLVADETELDNGLKVVTWRLPGAPTVGVTLGFPTGSGHDPPDQRGIAHLVEHLMFRHRYPHGMQHDDYMSSISGYANAYTYFDWTMYTAEVPRNQLEVVFWLEAHRLSRLAITPQDLDLEREVVMEEFLLDRERLYGEWWSEASSALFGDHGYGVGPLGEPASLSRLSLDDIHEYRERAQVADGAVLVIAGDVHHRDVVALAERYFGGLPRGEPRSPLEAPAMLGGRRTATANVPAPVLALFFPTVPAGHPDELGLYVLSAYLMEALSERDREQSLFSQSSASTILQWSLGSFGALIVTGAGHSGSSRDSAFDATWRSLEELIATPPTEAQAMAALRSCRLWGDNAADNSTRAMAVAEGHLQRGRWPSRWSSTRVAEQLHALAKKYLKRDRATEVWVSPPNWWTLSREVQGAIEQATPQPDASTGELPSRRFPIDHLPSGVPIDWNLLSLRPTETVERRLESGLELLALKGATESVTTVSVVLKRGAGSDPLGSAGLARLASQGALVELIASADPVDRGWAVEVRNQTTTFTNTVLPEEVEPAVRSIARLLRLRHLDSKSLWVARQAIVPGDFVLQGDPATLADELFWSPVMGSHRRTEVGGLEVDHLGLGNDAAREWWTESSRPENVRVYVAGPGDPTVWSEALVAEFDDGQATSVGLTTAPSIEPVAPRPPGVYCRDFPSDQVQIRIGFPTAPRTGEHRETSHRLLGFLESGLSAGLGELLRSDTGFIYGVQAEIEKREHGWALVISTATRVQNVEPVLFLIQRHLQRVRTGELIRHRDLTLPPLWINGALSIALGSSAQRVRWLEDARQGIVHGDPALHYRRMSETREEKLLESAKLFVLPAHMRVVLVGPRAEIEAELDGGPFSPVEPL